MIFNNEIFGYQNLTYPDKCEINGMERVKQTILTSESAKDFIEEKNISGSVAKSLCLELLADYTKYLKERVEYGKVDAILEKAELYSMDEISKLKIY